MSKKKNPLDEYVVGRAPVQTNQTGAGPIKDKRTKRNRDRSTQNRKAIEDANE